MATQEAAPQMQGLHPVLELLEAADDLKAIELFQMWLGNYQQTLDMVCRQLESLSQDPQVLQIRPQCARLTAQTVERVEAFNDCFRQAQSVAEFRSRFADLAVYLVLMQRSAQQALTLLTQPTALEGEQP